MIHDHVFSCFYHLNSSITLFRKPICMPIRCILQIIHIDGRNACIFRTEHPYGCCKFARAGYVLVYQPIVGASLVLHCIMAFNCFRQILRFFHLNDNSAQSSYTEDKLFKVRMLVDNLLESFKKHLYPSRNVSIDESMIGTKSRSSFRQYYQEQAQKMRYQSFYFG